MTYELHMNGVITGSLNSFCLACDIFFNSQEEATDHIGTSEHKKKSDAVQFSDKFQDEHIKKFRGGYYCEFCNVLLPIATKVNLHITEDEHMHNKGILLLKPMGGDVVAFNNVLIEEKAWHGLIEEVCALCNVEFEDEADHKTDTSHTLQLVLKTIQFGADNSIYRYLDDTAVQCLTCNKLLAPGRMTKHLDDTEHHEGYTKRRIEFNGVCHRIDTKENCQETEANGNCQGSEVEGNFQGSEAKGNCRERATNVTSAVETGVDKMKVKINKNCNAKSLTKDKSKILESITRYQSKGINIYLETETAFCKKCSNYVKFDYMEIENHIKNHSTAKEINSDLLYPSNLDQNLNRVDINDKTAQSSDDKQNTEEAKQDNAQNAASKAAASHEEDYDTDSSSSSITPHENFEKCSRGKGARDYAKANKIINKGDNNQSVCRICKVQVSPSFRAMREHVEGARHKNLVASSIKKEKTSGKQVKQSTKAFIQSACDVRGENYFVSIVNEEFCILRNSMFLISEDKSKLRCFVCEVNLAPYSDIVHHTTTLHHILKWQGVPVITSEKNEFIREVCPDTFHCGYCNLVVSGWAAMKRHLDCNDHRVTRSAGETRLRHHMPGLQWHKMQKNMEAMALVGFFNMYNAQNR